MIDRVFTRLRRLRIMGLVALPLLTTMPVLTTAPASAEEPAVIAEPQDVLSLWQAAPETIFDAAEIVPADLGYQARILVVFGEAEAQPQFRDQISLISAQIAELTRRDVIVIADGNPDAASPLRRQLRPRGFSIVLLDKDGTVVFRKPDLWDVREIGRQIDKLPSRLQEVRG